MGEKVKFKGPGEWRSQAAEVEEDTPETEEVGDNSDDLVE